MFKCVMLNDAMDIVDMECKLNGDVRMFRTRYFETYSSRQEISVGGFDLIYDSGIVQHDREQCAWSTRLGTAIIRANANDSTTPLPPTEDAQQKPVHS